MCGTKNSRDDDILGERARRKEKLDDNQMGSCFQDIRHSDELLRIFIAIAAHNMFLSRPDSRTSTNAPERASYSKRQNQDQPKAANAEFAQHGAHGAIRQKGSSKSKAKLLQHGTRDANFPGSGLASASSTKTFRAGDDL